MMHDSNPHPRTHIFAFPILSYPTLYYTSSDPGDWPWFARGTWDDGDRWWGCGGALVSPEFVLTAGE